MRRTGVSLNFSTFKEAFITFATANLFTCEYNLNLPYTLVTLNINVEMHTVAVDLLQRIKQNNALEVDRLLGIIMDTVSGETGFPCILIILN